MADKEECVITEPVRRRLPSYYRALIAMYANGEERVSSKKLAALVGACETQVKTDLTAIGCKGQPGYGYSIARLYRRIGEVMNVHDKYTAVIIGGGAFAEAVSLSHLFTKRGIKLAEKLPSIGSIEGGNGGFDAYCKRNGIDIMIIACDAAEAKECLMAAESAGIRGVVNFSEAELASEKLTVRNLHVDDILMMLCSEI